MWKLSLRLPLPRRPLRKPPQRSLNKHGRRAKPSLLWERKLGHPATLIAGVDEVGRGCLAGPVVAAAVILPAEVTRTRHAWISDIHDSKLVAPEMRGELRPLIEGWALAWAVGVATVEEIDQINIYHASHLAMKRALEALGSAPQHILIDGNVVPRGWPWPGTAIIKGDQKCLSVAAASILAKVWRDSHMAELDRQYPGYSFAEHKGYSTPAHNRALKQLGACAIHRRSFAPVADQLALTLQLSF